MKQLLAFILLNSCISVQAQNCDCLTAVKSLEKAYEANLASYQHQVVEYDRKYDYQVHKKAINEIAKRITATKDCIGLVAKYQSFFRDEHLFIAYKEGYYPYQSVTDTLSIKQAFAKEERLSNPPDYESIDKRIEGRWYFQDASFAVDIIPHAGINSEWAAILVTDNPPFWFRGQIKMELMRDAESHLNALYWRNSRSPKYFNVSINDSILELGKQFKFYRTKEKALFAKSKLSDTLSFKQLSEKTTYLRIPDFDGSLGDTIDSLVENNLTAIQQSPNLIIDVRNNGGGSDRSFRALLPLIFQNRIIPDPYTASVWVSPENLHYYDSTKYEYAETAADSAEGVAYVAALQKQAGKFEPILFSTDTLDFTYDYPQKIGIITNRKCASTTEGLVLLANESKKVIQFGENTSGTVSYGDWREIFLPGLPIWVSCTTKKMTFFNGKDIEQIGVEPKVKLNPEQENTWIEQVQYELEH